jgi:hypothetical protein
MYVRLTKICHYYVYLGFVTFSSTDMVDAVQQNRPHTIDGSKVRKGRSRGNMWFYNTYAPEMPCQSSSNCRQSYNFEFAKCPLF